MLILEPRLSRLGLLCGALGCFASACSWSRFSDLKEEVPVVSIQGSGSNNFGAEMGSAPGASLLVVRGEGTNTAVAYQINSDRPPESPIDSEVCSGSCSRVGDFVFLRNAASAQGTRPTCYLVGTGTSAGKTSVVGRCADRTEVILPTPQLPSPQSVPLDGVKYAASNDEHPVVAASWSKYVWFYPSSWAPTQPSPNCTTTPARNACLDTPTTGATNFGATLAVAATGLGSHLLAVGAPEDRKVFLFVLDSSGKAASVGCVSSNTQSYGKFLRSGILGSASSEKLIVGDGNTLSIYDASALAKLSSGSTCVGEASLPTGARISTIQCVESADATGCSTTAGSFGGALAFADLNGDGSNEILVGAPDMSTPPAAGSGAVLVYRLPEGGSSQLAEVRYVSSADTGERLGASVGSVRVGSRDVVVAGAPGANVLYLFYCSTLGGAGKDSFRCQ